MSQTTTSTVVSLEPVGSKAQLSSVSSEPQHGHGQTLGIKTLRDAIPAYCFTPSNFRSLSYIVWDVALSIGLACLVFNIIPLIENAAIRWTLWMAYGVLQGMIMTGIWIIAHECGHQALFTTQAANDSFGFVLHSLLLVPYFSWKYSHGLHHRYTNNMTKDMTYVPYRKSDQTSGGLWRELLEMSEDTPALALGTLVLQQLFGWPLYLMFNLSAGADSLQTGDRAKSQRQSHFDFGSGIFTAKQHPFIALSDFGLLAVLGGLYLAGLRLGFMNIALLYFVPYLWVNHWIVAITYLHHHHPDVNHFEAERWTFVDGALSTVDREFGLVGKYLFHGIIEFHVIHHLFARIPFYYAEEATKAIKEPLGDRYIKTNTNFFADLWQTWTTCRFVEPVPGKAGVLSWVRA